MSSPQPSGGLDLVGSEARFRDLCEHLPVGMFVIDVRDFCTYANQAARAMLGLTTDEALEHHWNRNLHPDDIGPVREHWQSAWASESDFIVEFRCQFADRPVAWLRGHAVPQRSSTGEIIGYVGTLRDITAERRAAQALYEKETLQVLQAGAEGLLDGTATKAELWDAIVQALTLDARQRQQLGKQHEVQKSVSALSLQELEVLRGIIQGKANKQIAKQLDVSLRTVESRRHVIFEKFQVKSVAELVRAVIEAGIEV